LSVREIVTDVELLKLPSEPITDPSIIWEVINDLIDTAEHHRTTKIGCLGLAANQIGYLSRVIVVWQNNGWMIMVNPSWHPRDGKQGLSHEGCLSRPSVSVKVKRHKRIEASWEDPTDVLPDRRSAKFVHLDARVIQHECDHLDGIFISSK
jgi:peptide deformylase